jgi:hypothetical protein
MLEAIFGAVFEFFAIVAMEIVWARLPKSRGCVVVAVVLAVLAAAAGTAFLFVLTR